MFVAAMLSACGESDVSVDYKLNDPVTLELYTESYYATLDLKGEEKMGTITATYADVNYSMKGDTAFVKRNYVIDKSRGYLKNFMPTERPWRRMSTSGPGILSWWRKSLMPQAIARRPDSPFLSMNWRSPLNSWNSLMTN